MGVPGFGQMKDLYKMQREAKKMQKELQKTVVKGYSEGEKISVTVDGTQEIVAVKIDESLMNPESRTKVQNGIKEAYKDAQKKLQKELVKDMDMDQLKGLLGG